MKAKITTNGRRLNGGARRNVELDGPLTNRGFLVGCALIAEAIEWAATTGDDVEGLATILKRVHRSIP